MFTKFNSIYFLQKMGLRRRSWLDSLIVIGNISFIVFTISFIVFTYINITRALTYFLGEPRFLGIKWAVILAITFLIFEFAGSARLFSPDENESPSEKRYLLGTWILATAFVNLLVWWNLASVFSIPNSIVYFNISNTLSNLVPAIITFLAWVIKLGLIKISTMNIGSRIELNEDPIKITFT
jgi:hypothetical protein